MTPAPRPPDASGGPAVAGVRRLGVRGAMEFTPRVFRDERGLTVVPFHGERFLGAHGAPLFPPAQTLLSTSRRGVLRGVHFTATPPGCAKYVHCVRGAALDFVVDLRVGSPTFGVVDTVLLDAVDFRAVYLPAGLGHAFLALEDDTSVAYLLSAPYRAEHELAVSALDPRLGLALPGGIDPVLSGRDLGAPTLAEAAARGLLPGYAA
ncbi:dTDP-4-dehydrorhamnose 3,5-epimerase family protein [Streptomyces sp. NPDC051567]|uniref:dTDP-4-dehydrorhamnose 3,5-epimerase family protein n=1 Tax=Streptomyces sp. NPDC051567 TaxID=3365660 RepID=UPI00378E5984